MKINSKNSFFTFCFALINPLRPKHWRDSIQTQLDLISLLPMKTGSGKDVEMHMINEKIVICIPPSKNGREARSIMINRFIELDDLFFEALGLWVGEGGKDKGLYFGNSSAELISRFLKFVEEKFGINRQNFKVTLNAPVLKDENLIKARWSKILQIPIRNFTRICIDPRISQEYAQIYYNGIVLSELMKTLQKKLEPVILSTERFAIPFLRGMFAAEGQVALKKWGTLFYVSFSSVDGEIIRSLKRCFQLLGITTCKYMYKSRKFPIYGYKNLKCFKELGIHTLHPDKRAKFELGFANYKRVNVMHGEEARALILQQLTSGPKTYDDLAAALDKARTTIQAWHVPILEREGKVKRSGKRGQAWLWAPAEGKSSATTKV